MLFKGMQTLSSVLKSHQQINTTNTNYDKGCSSIPLSLIYSLSRFLLSADNVLSIVLTIEDKRVDKSTRVLLL